MTSFSLRTLKLRPGEQLQDEQEVVLEPLEFGGQRYIAIPEQVSTEFVATRATTGTVFELRFRARLHGPCQRCLRDAVVEQSVSAREYEATNPEGSDELRSPYVNEDRLDISGWARDALALSLPEQILCRADCAGLCFLCGKDLNDEPHEHEHAETDSRWAALEELKDRL